MKNGTMLSDVVKFNDADFFAAHRFGWLATTEKVYRIDFFSLAHADCEDAIYDGAQPISDWMSRLHGLSGIYYGISYGEDDRFITLSTCSRSTGNERTVLTGHLVEICGGIKITNAKKKIAALISGAAMMTNLAAVHACAAGDVASVITSTWNSVRGQVQTIVNNVVFPVLDVILVVLLFVKIEGVALCPFLFS